MKYTELFVVKPGSKVKLSQISPDLTAGYKDKGSAKKDVEKSTGQLRDLQYRLYAEGKRSLLICLQGLDAAGKDGTINHVFGAMNLQGTRVCAFKVPSKEEAAHDFLWRIERQVPAQGEVVIFNRSHYEDVLVTRVHKLVDKEVWSQRYDQINAFEQRLAANGTHILKFFLHISPQEQLKRFKQRLEDPARHWKISESDYSDRALWNDYMEAYEDVLRKTSTGIAPWFVIPSDYKWYRNIAIARIVVEKLRSLDLQLPEPQANIEEICRKYHEASVSAENNSQTTSVSA